MKFQRLKDLNINNSILHGLAEKIFKTQTTVLAKLAKHRLVVQKSTDGTRLQRFKSSRGFLYFLRDRRKSKQITLFSMAAGLYRPNRQRSGGLRTRRSGSTEGGGQGLHVEVLTNGRDAAMVTN